MLAVGLAGGSGSAVDVAEESVSARQPALAALTEILGLFCVKRRHEGGGKSRIWAGCKYAESGIYPQWLEPLSNPYDCPGRDLVFVAAEVGDPGGCWLADPGGGVGG